jgi:hypothetical protein
VDLIVGGQTRFFGESGATPPIEAVIAMLENPGRTPEAYYGALYLTPSHPCIRRSYRGASQILTFMRDVPLPDEEPYTIDLELTEADVARWVTELRAQQEALDRAVAGASPGNGPPGSVQTA